MPFYILIFELSLSESGKLCMYCLQIANYFSPNPNESITVWHLKADLCYILSILSHFFVNQSLT